MIIVNLCQRQGEDFGEIPEGVGFLIAPLALAVELGEHQISEVLPGAPLQRADDERVHAFVLEHIFQRRLEHGCADIRNASDAGAPQLAG